MPIWADTSTVQDLLDQLAKPELPNWQMVEDAMATLARGLRALGVRRFVVAGGETSGAVVQALEVDALEIGPEIDPGVPWTVSLDSDPVALALKSGNFGKPDFFQRALQRLSASGTDGMEG